MKRLLCLVVGLSLSLKSTVIAADPKPVAPENQKRRLIDIREYGARGDGRSDDTEFFQKAIDELSPYGGVLFVPEGNYRITKRLEVKGSHPKADKVLDYVEIVGAGKNAARLLGDGADYIIGAADVKNEKTGKRTFVQGFNIRDITLAPSSESIAAGKIGGGLDASYMIRWAAKNCHFVGLNTGIYSLQRDEMPEKSVDESMAVFIIRIHDNLFYGCKDYAIKLGRIFDVSIENNEIEHGSGGVKIGETGDEFDAAANNVRIVNNLFEGLGWNRPAISGSCWIGSRIIGNYFEANQGGDIELVSGPKDGWGRSLTIASNTFQPNQRQREGSYGPIKLVKVFDTVITGNFTTGANLLHPESASLGKGVNLISNTLNNPPEIGELGGAGGGNAVDYAGKLSENSKQQAERWSVSGPLGSVGIHSLYGLQFEPKGEKTRSLTYASAPPTDNTARRQVGDLLLNSSPTISSDKKILVGWVCTESGSPGTWKSLWMETKD